MSLLLAAKGAVIVDADLIARLVVEPGGPCLGRLVEHFGDTILQSDGTLDRAQLAAKVFGFPDELKVLNGITHPAIAEEMTRQITEHAGTDKIVVMDAASLFGTPRVGMVGRMLVDVDPEVAVERLVRYRGFSESDARARIASQMSREERLAMADFVIDNSGTHEDLERGVERAWEWIQTLPDSP